MSRFGCNQDYCLAYGETIPGGLDRMFADSVDSLANLLHDHSRTWSCLK